MTYSLSLRFYESTALATELAGYPDLEAWLIAGLCALVGLVGAVLGAILANRHSTNLARATGQFDRPHLSVRLWGQRLNQLSPASRWYLVHPGDADTYGLYLADLVIENEGGAKSGDFILTVTANSGALVDKSELGSHRVSPAVIADTIQSRTATIGHFRQNSYALPSIPPRSGLSIQEPLLLKPTFKMIHEVKARTKDDVDVTVGVEFTIAVVCSFNITLADHPSLAQSVSVVCIEAANTHDAIDKIGRSLDQEFQRKSRTHSIRFFLPRMFRQHRVKHVVTDFTTFETRTEEGLTLHFLGGEGSQPRTKILTIYAPSEVLEHLE